MSLEPLRCAADHLEIHYKGLYIYNSKWNRLSEWICKDKKTVALGILDSSGREICSFQLKGRFKGGELALRDKAHGVAIHLRKAPKKHSAQSPASVRVVISGRAFSSRSRGTSLTRRVLRGVEQLLFRDRGDSVEERWEALDPYRKVYEAHIAADVGVRGSADSRWVDDVVFGGGNVDDAREPWVCRAKSAPDLFEASRDHDARMSGRSSRGGRSFRLKGTHIWMTVYEKHRSPREENWRLLKEVLKKRGLKKGDGVLRLEFKLQRGWMQSQKVKGRSLSDFSVDEFLEYLPTLTALLSTRYRHTEPGEGRRERRALSRFGQVAHETLALMGTPTKDAIKSKAIVARSVVSSGAVQRKRIIHALNRLIAHGGEAGAPLSVQGFADLLAYQANQGVRDNLSRDGLNRLRAQHGLTKVSKTEFDALGYEHEIVVSIVSPRIAHQPEAQELANATAPCFSDPFNVSCEYSFPTADQNGVCVCRPSITNWPTRR